LQGVALGRMPRAARRRLWACLKTKFHRSYEKRVDFVDMTDAGWAARRRYKTRWERVKRKRLRETEFEVVELEIRRSLAKKLHAWTPKGVGFKEFFAPIVVRWHWWEAVVGVLSR
jgi:hypothetical protein